MYNESQKKEYIETCLWERIENKTLSLTSVNATFKFTEEYEEQYGKDVAFFSEEELLTMLKAKGSRSLTSLQNTVSFLRQYASYVLGPNLDNGYKGITKDKLQRCVAEEKAGKALLSREDVDSLQQKMLNAVDKAILECLFIGVSGKNLEDLTYLSQEQLDTESKTLTLTSGKVFHLSERQCQLLIDAFSETENVSYQGDQESVPVSGFGRLYKERCNVLSGDTPDRRFRWVLRRVVIWKDYFGLAVLTMKTIAMSGLVHELKQGMASTGLGLRDYLKTAEGKSLAQRYGYTSDAHYVDIIMDKVKKYFL